MTLTLLCCGTGLLFRNIRALSELIYIFQQMRRESRQLYLRANKVGRDEEIALWNFRH
jgi:hypothetical protein